MQVRYVLEDRAHELFVPALFQRVAREAGIEIAEESTGHLRGASTTISALRQLLADINKNIVAQPDLIIVGIDTDCGRQGDREQQVERACRLEQYDGPVLIAEPEPHIEIWYLADPEFIQRFLNTPDRPIEPKVRCKRSEYKDLLRSIVQSSGVRSPLGGIEYGSEIANGMDLYHAGRNVPSLKRFIDIVKRHCDEHQRQAL